MNSKITEWLPNEKASIVWQGEEYDYCYICYRVLTIAKILNSIAGSGKNVGIFMKRCPDVIFSMLASLISGNVYVPIDIIMPLNRVKYILENANVEYVFTSSEFQDNFLGKKVILVDEITNDIAVGVTEFEENSEAYIIYTSGSTGLPKGVSISKENLMTFMEGVIEKIPFIRGYKIACLTSYSFDIFFLESLMALHEGMKVYFANEQQKNNPITGLKFIVENEIEMLQLTPSRMQQFINYDNKLDFLKNIKILMIGGEEMPKMLLKKIQSGSSCRIYNMYGPTEATIWATIGDLTDSSEVHVGEPLKDTEVYIVDEKMNICESDIKGELCITGKLLSKGYYNNVEMTEKKFCILNGERAYHTGDIASISKDGFLHIYGRMDNQVKIRGYRIEIEEIENTIRNTGLVDNIVVLAINIYENGDKKLVGFFSVKNEQVNISMLKKYLNDFLPQYMIPEQFCEVKKFPLTASGKIDRNKIKNTFLYNQNVKTKSVIDESEFDDVEKRIITIFRKYLEDNRLAVNLDSDVSGVDVDSVSFVKIIVEIEREFEIEFEMEEVFGVPTRLRTVRDWVKLTKKHKIVNHC